MLASRCDACRPLAGVQAQRRPPFSTARTSGRCRPGRPLRRVVVQAAADGGGGGRQAGAPTERQVEYKVRTSASNIRLLAASPHAFFACTPDCVSAECAAPLCRMSPGCPRAEPRLNSKPFLACSAALPPCSRQDSLTDVAFIGLCRIAYGNIAGWQSSRSWTDGGETFKGMVEVSRALMRGRTAAQQRDAVIAGFPQVPAWFRRCAGWGRLAAARCADAYPVWGSMSERTVPAQQPLPSARAARCLPPACVVLPPLSGVTSSAAILF